MHDNIWCVDLCLRDRSVIRPKPSDESQILYLVHLVAAYFFMRPMSKMVRQQNLAPITHQLMSSLLQQLTSFSLNLTTI